MQTKQEILGYINHTPILINVFMNDYRQEKKFYSQDIKLTDKGMLIGFAT